MAKVNAQWAAADANNDGKLDLAEWKVFSQASRKAEADEGNWVDQDDRAEETYAAFNQMSEGDGFTIAEMFTCYGPWIAKFEELKAAAGM
jgi:hypothetical protein